MINVIADRYAQALFEVGEETQTTSELYQELSELVDIFNENKDVEVIIHCAAIAHNKGNDLSRDNFMKVNYEATIEIAKQLRLRDIGGIIIIDYIDMHEEENKKEIIELLAQSLKKDRTKSQILGFTKLNLLEMTRKNMCNNDDY